MMQSLIEKTPDPMGLYVAIYKGNVYVRTFMISDQIVVHGDYIHIYIYIYIYIYTYIQIYIIISRVLFQLAVARVCIICRYCISERSHQ